MRHAVQKGAWIAMRPEESVTTFWVIVPPETESWPTPSMIVSGRKACVVGMVQTMWKCAPARRSPASLVLRTEMLPPTTKQAGPALRLLAGEAEGDCVVFA